MNMEIPILLSTSIHRVYRPRALLYEIDLQTAVPHKPNVLPATTFCFAAPKLGSFKVGLGKARISRTSAELPAQ